MIFLKMFWLFIMNLLFSCYWLIVTKQKIYKGLNNDNCMANAVNNGKRKPITPSENPAVLQEWKDLFNKYRSEGMQKVESYKAIADLYNIKAFSVIHYWISSDGRERKRETNKFRPKYSQRVNENVRKQHADRNYLTRHIDEYVTKAFENSNGVKSEDELTFDIRDIMREQDRTPILMKNSTLQSVVQDYEKAHGKLVDTFLGLTGRESPILPIPVHEGSMDWATARKSLLNYYRGRVYTNVPPGPSPVVPHEGGNGQA